MGSDFGAGLAVLEWNAWRGFLVGAVFPRASRVPVDPRERWERLLARVPPDARTVLPHVDLSRTGGVPRGRAELFAALRERGARVLNEHVTDISKGRIQRECARLGLPVTAAAREGDPDEWVLVKTDLNSGGRKERWLSPAERRRLGVGRLSRQLRDPGDYRVVRRRDVPPSWWSDPALSVERYVTNSRDAFYRVYVLGRQQVVSRAVSGARVRRMEGKLERRNAFFRDFRPLGDGGELPPDLLDTVRAFVAGFRLDYGALDLVEDDEGRAYVVDVNDTPYWGDEVQPGVLEHLAAQEIAP